MFEDKKIFFCGLYALEIEFSDAINEPFNDFMFYMLMIISNFTVQRQFYPTYCIRNLSVIFNIIAII